MQKPLLALLALTVLSGCGTTMSPLAGKAPMSRAMAARSVDADKHAIAPPVPQPARQGFTKKNQTEIATLAYAQAFHAETAAEAQKIARNALEKIEALVPNGQIAKEIVPFAEAVMKTKVDDQEDAKRLALWPLHYIIEGLDDAESPMFFQMATKMMESMLNWKDGAAVGLVTLDACSDSPNAYVKVMATKAMVAFQNPRTDLQTSFKATLDALKDIGETLASLTPKKH